MSLIRRRTPVAVDGDHARPWADRHRSGRTTSPARRLIRAVLVIAAGTAALTLAGPFALRPFADVAGAAGAAGDVSVAFVLDFGGTPATLVSGCVSVPDGEDGYTALRAFTDEKGLVAPAYSSSELLCSINGVPASPNECGQSVPDGYIYWSYFTGGVTGWTYANTGAFAPVSPNVVQGWRFQDPGYGNPRDPAPRTAPTYASLCPSAPSATTTTTTFAPPPTPTTAGAGASATPTPAAVNGGPKATARTSHPVAASNSATTTSTPGGVSAGGASGSTVPAPQRGIATSPSGANQANGSAIGVATVTRHDPSGSGLAPVIVGALLVVGLAAAAWIRWRRRLGTP